jgi:undecaprenyl-diphosphatase
MIVNADQQLFLLLNSCHSPFWDEVMYAISGRLIWIPLYIGILVAIWYKYRKKFLTVLIAVAVTVTVSDQLSNIIKKSVKRPRPCHEVSLSGKVHTVRGKCGGAYGFVSSHATNSFTVAVLSLFLLRRMWFSAAMILWAAAIGYSRIYLGVHYPGDVLAGSVLGLLTGWTAWKVIDFIDRKNSAGKDTVSISQ